MREITLRFPSIIELVDFHAVIASKAEVAINKTQHTVTGNLSEAEIELAMNNFQAEKLDENAPKNQLSK